MIDLTPLDVRNKRGDFKKIMRGYDPQEVDVFLELVAERLEALVRENLQLKERTQTLQNQVTTQLGREKAVQDALVTAQALREDIKAQSQREAAHVLREAEAEARRLIAEAEAQVRGKLRGVERRIDGAKDGLQELERRRARFIKDFRQLLERELDVVQVEEERIPLEERPIDLELGRPTPPMTPSTSARERPLAEGAAPADVGAAPPPPEPVDDRPPAMPLAAAPATAAATPRSQERPVPDDDAPTPGERPVAERDAEVQDLSASVEAEALAEARGEVVEVTGADGERLADVPGLEEVLAEAGAELAEAPVEPVAPAPQSAEEIAPPRVKERDNTLFLYPDPDDTES